MVVEREDEREPSALAGDGASGPVDRRAWASLLVLCAALFLDALDVSMIGVSLPSIGADLGLSTSSLQWVVSGYVVGYGGFLLLGGRTADLLGRRRVFVVSLAVFAIFSGLGGLATNGALLLAARFVTGVSAAFTTPAGLSMITTTFAEGSVRNRALAIYTATGASGISLGLVLGGLLTEVSWRWVFFVPVFVALATWMAALRLLPRDGVHETSGRFDVAGAVCVTLAMLLLVFAVVEAPTRGWGSARTLASLAAVAGLLGVFVLIELRVSQPLVRLGILRSGTLVRANVGAMSLFGGWLGFLFVATLYMQDVRGWSPLETGLAVAPAGIIVAVAAPRVAAPLVARFGLSLVICCGLLCTAIAYALFLRIDVDSNYVPVMLPTFVLIGAGFTLAYGPLNIAATNGVIAEEQGLAGGLVTTSFQMGGAIVLAVVTAVVTSATAGSARGARLDGLRAGLVVSMGVAVIGAAVTAIGLVRRRRRTMVPAAPTGSARPATASGDLFSPAALALLASDALAHLCTVDPDGNPQASCIWVTWNGHELVSGHLNRSVKLHNIKRDPRVILTLESPSRNAGGLREYLAIAGTGQVERGGAPELLRELARTYLTPDADFPPSDAEPGYVLRIKPTRVGGVGPWTT